MFKISATFAPFFLFSFFGLTVCAPALARDWGNVGGWHVSAGTNSCGLYTDDRGGLINVGGTEIVLLRRIDGGVYLQVTNLAWALPPLDENQIFFEIDGQRYNGLSNVAALPAYPARGFLAVFGDGFEAAIRRGSTLDIGVNAGKIAQISLRGSTAALNMLGQCLNDLRAGGAINTAAGAVVATNVAESPGFAALANVAAKPIGSPGNWVEASDYPRDFDARALSSVGAATAFKLTIAPSGRAADCVVMQSSGLDNLDKAACRAMMRNARFIPAADILGNPVIGSYENIVIWKAP